MQPDTSIHPHESTKSHNSSVPQSRIMFAKVDTGSVILDTVELYDALTDSFPCVNIANSDSLYCTWQHGDSILAAMLEHGAAAVSQPGSNWTSLGVLTSDGIHPMSAIDGDNLHAVWREIETKGNDTRVVIMTSSFSLTGDWQGWQAGSSPSGSDTLDKTNAVVAGAGVSVWQEKVGGIWQIRGEVRGDTITLVDADSNAMYPHAVAESSAVSPSVNQVRVKLLWAEEVKTDTCELKFQVDSINVSNAGADAMKFNNGCKLIRKALSDSLLAVYTDADDAVMYAYSAAGDSWKRDLLAEDSKYPAIAEDGTGRRWVAVISEGVAVDARYRNGSTWSSVQQLHTDDSIGPVSLAGASDDTDPCAYAAFRAAEKGGAVVVAKFDGDSLVLDTVATGEEELGDPCIAVEPGANGDYLHVCWEDAGEIKYTMTGNAVAADDWDNSDPEDPLMDWESVINLSNTSGVQSRHPVVAADDDRVIVAWAERTTPDVLVRYRSTDSSYSTWQDTVNLSETSNASSDYPTIALGDTAVVIWHEIPTAGPGTPDTDIYASIEYGDAFCLMNAAAEATYPHGVFQTKDSTPYLHLLWSEAPSANYYEAGYSKCDLSEAGGGGGQGGAQPFIRPKLYACRPNPFTGRTRIRYQFPREGNVLLRVYDASGRMMRTLQSGRQKPGVYTLNWDGCDSKGRQVANGIYFYRLDVPGYRDVKKAVMMR